MVDNINLNKTTPLLSSAERVKRVDRRQRDQQKPPFKDALEDEKKKKKKKKKKKRKRKRKKKKKEEKEKKEKE